jgi:hypothetical protein
VANFKVLSKNWSGGNSHRLLAVRFRVTWDKLYKNKNKEGLNVEVNVNFRLKYLKKMNGYSVLEN